MKLLFGSCVILSVFVSGLALKCPTCSGSSCQSSDVPLQECIFRQPRPVFKDLRYMTYEADAEYGCLHIVYSQDGADKEVRQCVVINPKNDGCESLKKMLNVKFCQIQRDSYVVENTGDAADKIATDKTPTDKTPTDKTPTAKTPTDKTPTDKTPTDNTPTDKTPTDKTPTDKTPTDKTPTDKTPTDKTPTDNTPTDKTPTDKTPTDKTPTDNTPTDNTPTDKTPTDKTPTDKTPTDKTPTDKTPTDKTPTGKTPTDETPTGETPTEDPNNSGIIHSISSALIFVILLRNFA